jgi:NAD(P)H-flavin reductase/truncated hemoglobin YjbI
MTIIQYKDTSYHCHPNETVLQVFLRHSVDIPFSCKNGVCHVCVMRLLKPITDDDSQFHQAQKGLKQNLIDKYYFKVCCYVPDQNIEIADAQAADMLTYGMIAKKEMLSDDVCRFLIEPATNMDYHSGQFINLQRSDGEMRSYSLCSVSNEDYFLEIQVKKVDNGLFSHWLFNELEENDKIEFQGPNGQSYYDQTQSAQPLLLIGTGTGVSPLYGIVRDALLNGHENDIYLYHGSHNKQGLYLHDTLQELSTEYPRFHYIACVSGDLSVEDSDDGFTPGRANELALTVHKQLDHWQIFLCGQPEMVEQSKQQVSQSGAKLSNIHTDPFWPLSTPDQKPIRPELIERRHYPKPNLAMWQTLQEGKLLTLILTDFYNLVYDDPKLASFFENTTKQRSIEKQYNFLYQVFTGEKVYFGERPRNAHHWMVISDELFDYRARIMEKCLRLHGLSETFIKQWFIMEDDYRCEIVKNKPWNRLKFGKEIPMDGYEELTMDAATLCDNCQAEINVGDVVRYHVRIGKVYCSKCMQNDKPIK